MIKIRIKEIGLKDVFFIIIFWLKLRVILKFIVGIFK